MIQNGVQQIQDYFPTRHRYSKLCFDYSEHHLEHPNICNYSAWLARENPFSIYVATFEVRTYRLCRRILMFHCFPEELGLEACLVNSTNITYKQSPVASFIVKISQSFYIKSKGAGCYLKKSLPPLDLEYSLVPDSRNPVLYTVQEINPESIKNIPIGVDSKNYQWIDLDSEGLPGVFTTNDSCWFYKHNISANKLGSREGLPTTTAAQLGPTEILTPKPSSADGALNFVNLAGDGQLNLVHMDINMPGFNKHNIKKE